jgi:hypothetical protein
MPTLFRLLLLAAIALLFANCSTPNAAKEKKAARELKEQQAMGDVSFQSFVSRLRKAIELRDTAQLSSMMAGNFGYRLEPPGEGAGVFEFWNQAGLWSELALVCSEKFVPKDNFMVAPAQFATDPEYRGYRAGITRVEGAWRFAYFVTD